MLNKNVCISCINSYTDIMNWNELEEDDYCGYCNDDNLWEKGFILCTDGSVNDIKEVPLNCGFFLEHLICQNKEEHNDR